MVQNVYCIKILFRVQDADKLDAIGAFGVLRCAAFSGAKNRPLYVPEHVAIENISQQDYLKESSNNNSAITHFHGMYKLFIFHFLFYICIYVYLCIKENN
jgi:hypothetical protein